MPQDNSTNTETTATASKHKKASGTDEKLLRLGAEFQKVDAIRNQRPWPPCVPDNLDNKWWSLSHEISELQPKTKAGLRITALVLVAAVRDGVINEIMQPCAVTLARSYLDDATYDGLHQPPPPCTDADEKAEQDDLDAYMPTPQMQKLAEEFKMMKACARLRIEIAEMEEASA